MDQTIPHPELYAVPYTTHAFNGMPWRALGRSGLRASNVGIGTWKFGFPETGDGARLDEKTAYDIFDRSVELGATFWDTANRYNNASGNSERVIGRWFKRNPDQRRNVVLATKVLGGMDGVSPNHCRASRGNILDSVRACLDRLQVQHIDLLYFHVFDAATPPEESLAAVEDLVREGLVRYFAVSNFSVDQLKLYKALEASFTVRARVVAVQNRFDILNGESGDEPGVLDYAAASGVSFIAYSPLARGLLSERYLEPDKAKPGDRLYDEGTLKKDASPEIMARLKKLAALAREWDISISQLAIAYMLTLPGMGPVIASVSSVKQLESNAAAGKIVLSGEQTLRIRQALEKEG